MRAEVRTGGKENQKLQPAKIRRKLAAKQPEPQVR